MEFIDKIEKTFSKADYDRIMAAYDFAAIAHANTYRKGTRIPYIKHPIEAAEVVLEMTSDPSIIIATLLHDVVEDTHYSIADIQERFGGRVAELVSYETEDKRKGQKESDT